MVEDVAFRRFKNQASGESADFVGRHHAPTVSDPVFEQFHEGAGVTPNIVAAGVHSGSVVMLGDLQNVGRQLVFIVSAELVNDRLIRNDL